MPNQPYKEIFHAIEAILAKALCEEECSCVRECEKVAGNYGDNQPDEYKPAELTQPLNVVKVSKLEQAVSVILAEIVSDAEISSLVSTRELGYIARAMSGEPEDIETALEIIQDLEVSTEAIEQYTRVILSHHGQ